MFLNYKIEERKKKAPKSMGWTGQMRNKNTPLFGAVYFEESLTLGELFFAAGRTKAVMLAFFFTRITLDEPCLFKNRT